MPQTCPICTPKGYIYFSFSFSYTAAFGLQVMAYLQYRIINMRFPNNDIHIFQTKVKIEN